MRDNRKQGIAGVLVSYVCWGLLTAFWDLLKSIDPVYILAQRVIWSMAFMLLFLALRRRLSDIRQIFSSLKTIGLSLLSGILVCINWGVYIYAINSGHVLDASLGYFLEPIFVTAIGVFGFHEKMRPLEKVTAACSVAGVAYLIFTYRVVPVLAILIGLSFAVYGAVKKKLTLDAELSLFAETLMVTPLALAFCIIQEARGTGSLTVFHGAQFLLFPMAGVVTSIPLLCFNQGVRRIPYYLTGILMYVNPTIQFLMGLFYFGEALELPRLTAFIFIWIGVAFALVQNVRDMRLPAAQAE